jgi:hypothetical protein
VELAALADRALSAPQTVEALSRPLRPGLSCEALIRDLPLPERAAAAHAPAAFAARVA